MLTNKRAILLDMNGTFMFGEDRFGSNEDFSKYYRNLNGQLPDALVNEIIRKAYMYLDIRYTMVEYREKFPSVRAAILNTCKANLPEIELCKLIDTFAFHELGYIPQEYQQTLRRLAEYYVLAAVIDIWSSKVYWLNTFNQLGIAHVFSAISFSSDLGIVKPSAKPFEYVLRQLNLTKEHAVVVGDSIRRDLGGANAAGIDCVLVGGSQDKKALSSFVSLMDFSKHLLNEVY